MNRYFYKEDIRWLTIQMVGITIQEMQIKTTMRPHLTPFRTAILSERQEISIGEDVEKSEYSYTIGGNMLVQPLWRFLTKLIAPSYYPAITLLGIYPIYPYIYIHIYMHIWVSIYICMHSYVHCSIIYNSQGMKTPKY